MMAQRTARGPHGGTGTAVHVALEYGRARGVGEEAEGLDRGTEQRDHACADAGRHVHHTRVAGHNDRSARETRACFLEREFARHVDDVCAERSSELAILRTTDRDHRVSELRQVSGERLPVRHGPPFGRMRRAGRDDGERPVAETDLGKPMRHVRP